MFDNAFKILISIVVLSGGGTFYVLWNRLREARILSDAELIEKLRLSKSVCHDINCRVAEPTADFWKTKILPNIYKEIEKIIARVRINILKIEGGLFRLVNYIRGKRNINANENSEKSQYWKDVGEFKNEVK